MAVHALGLGNGGLWLSFLILLAGRGLSQALAYPGLTRRTFGMSSPLDGGRAGVPATGVRSEDPLSALPERICR